MSLAEGDDRVNSKTIRTIKLALAALSAVRLIPHLVLFLTSSKRALLDADLQRWVDEYGVWEANSTSGRVVNFAYMMTYHPEYRSVFYFRHRQFGHVFGLLCKGMSSVAINARSCGPGLFLHHGYGTRISAESIGANLSVGQSSMIGYVNNGIDRPTVGDNVTIGAGARVLGAVRLGDNARVGPNSVVISNVPANCTVMGVPAAIVWRKPVTPAKPGVPPSRN